MEAILESNFNSTYEKEGEKLLQYIRKEINNSDEAEDILHDIFSQVLSKLNVLDTLNNTGAWLYSVARNRIIDWHRKKENQNISLIVQNESGTWEEMLIESKINVEDEFERKLVGDAILDAIDELPDEQKDIFIANVIEGVTFREFSEDSGISINTLLSRKQYALVFLKKRLQEIKDLMDNKG
jgi:RNA polymerase sigma factor (sigma-70 family)